MQFLQGTLLQDLLCFFFFFKIFSSLWSLSFYPDLIFFVWSFLFLMLRLLNLTITGLVLHCSKRQLFVFKFQRIFEVSIFFWSQYVLINNSGCEEIGLMSSPLASLTGELHSGIVYRDMIFNWQSLPEQSLLISS